MYEGRTAGSEGSWKRLTSVDKDCFGCGPENKYGLQMSFESDGKQLRSTVDVDERFRGWSNLIHGGILSTMLDETMGWTVICLTGKFMLTRDMRITFKKPVRVGSQLTVIGSIKQMKSPRRALVEACIIDQHGDECAASEAEFALFSREQFLRMNIMDEDDLQAMEAAMIG